MRINLKPLNDQVLVITGASSGIGLTTARMAARKGAQLVLAARNESALRELEQEINEKTPGQAIAVVADVGREEDVHRIADAAVERFDGIDTWVNNAGVSIYGRIEEVDLSDARRMFDTDFWGVVHGSRVALRHLRDHGGALINVGSTVSDRAIPLQGFYVASKHAVKGFTDSLRMEIEEAGVPISVTLIKPAGINTPFTQHAKNYMGNEPDFPPPVYAPETVARSILHAATHVVRDIMVGSAAKTFSVAEKYMPRVTDRYMEKTMFTQQQKKSRPRQRRPDALYRAGEGLMQDGDYEGHVMRTSAYTAASLHPLATVAILGLAGVAAAAALLGIDRGRQARNQYLNV